VQLPLLTRLSDIVWRQSLIGTDRKKSGRDLLNNYPPDTKEVYK
jgi:hypothetical protein